MRGLCKMRWRIALPAGEVIEARGSSRIDGLWLRWLGLGGLSPIARLGEGGKRAARIGAGSCLDPEARGLLAVIMTSNYDD